MKEEEKNKTSLHVEEHEKDLLIDHSYDGIQELNHPLPSWWNFIFWAAIIYSTAYFVYYQYKGGTPLKDEFVADYAKIKSIQEAEKKKHGQFDEKQYALFATSDGIKKGEEVYTNNCLACHMEKGKGDIGPNLTDEHWLWAKGTPETVFPIVYNGVVENGMPNWSEVLSTEEIYQVVAYVQTLKGLNVPGGKAPQGDKIE